MTGKKVIIALAVALALLGCHRKPQPPLVFGAGVWPGYESFYLARDLGYYAKDNIRFTEFTSNADTEQAFRNQGIQVAALTLEQALQLRRDIPEVKIILLIDRVGESRMDVLVTRDDNIGSYPKEIAHMLQGWRQALAYLHDSPDKAVQAMAQHEHLAPAQFGQALKALELYGWQNNQQMMMGEPPPVGAKINEVQRRMLNEGKLSFGIDPSMLLDATLLVEPRQ